LRAAQGEFVPKPRRPIVDELILTVLSQATSDVNSGRAFAALQETWPTWDAVLAAPVRQVADAIRSGGIADVKAARIKTILREIETREGSIDLERLNGLTDEEVDDYLCSLPGIGPKTAACVLVFSMGRPAFPVDTHVLRIVRRLGWVAPKLTAEKVQAQLTPRIPPELRYDLHVALIRHGREICVARGPLCSECPVFELCEAGPKLLAAGEAR
jgi:endonuclease-3